MAETKRGNGKFCSISCSVKYNNKLRRKNQKHNTICAYCNISFYKPKSKLGNSKSGLYFCCRDHKDISQRIGGIKEIQPPHYGTSKNINSLLYRKKAFESYPHHCNKCGRNEHINVLEIHHKDRNKTNNNISNLEILCPTCHQIHHFVDKSGRWSLTKLKNNLFVYIPPSLLFL